MDGKNKVALKEIERLTAKADEVQENILKEILTQNSATEYLIKYMKGSKNMLEFKQSVPVITYKAIRPYIQRIANGEDSSLITSHPITEMIMSTGTSEGKPKLMPSVEEDLDRNMFFVSLITPILNQYVLGVDKGKRMYFFFVKKEISTPCGLPVRTAISRLLKSIHFKRGWDNVDDVGEEDDVPNDKLVDLVQVRLGCYYELVVATFAGLYRYRVNGVLQVIGFHNRAPQVRYICRRNVILSIDDDKTNEEDLQKSINVTKKLLEPCSALLVDYTSYADASTMPGHYVLYWEILFHGSLKVDDRLDNIAAIDDKVLQECCIAVEEELDYTYRICRTHNKSIRPLEIRVVEPGTFQELMDFFIDQGASINQHKTPRCIKSKGALKLLNSHMKASFFSPREPK
ncbi:hypothetical protein SO802_011892 [Lithocarpus litseifolius]|uniref:Uncharacterized protein n=1 Tax=Lithocarpus litseifolius TaxID=425828 RepID=A0AAW2D1Y7_9ROSI